MVRRPSEDPTSELHPLRDAALPRTRIVRKTPFNQGLQAMQRPRVHRNDPVPKKDMRSMSWALVFQLPGGQDLTG